MHPMRPIVIVIALALIAPAVAGAQHEAHMMGTSASATPALSGQYAFATISEIVKILKADSTTDWSKVNLEALRQHLADMDDVILRATVRSQRVPGGVAMDITGTGRTAAAITRMVTAHAEPLEEHTPYHAVAKGITGGVRLTVTAKNAADARTVAMIRGLGFAGIMVEGDHHAAHHLAMARGTGMAHH
jgi:hypothetical protein